MIIQLLGVRTADDMKFINEDDLRHHLPLLDCRKLLHAFRRKYNNQQNHCTMATSEPEIILTLSPNTSRNSEPSLEPASSVSVQNSTWVSAFSVPWEKTHESLRRCLAQGKRPEAADRWHMVRVIAEAIRQVCLNPPFKQCAELAKSIVDKFPESFEDRTEEGERMGNGYYTLSKQLRTRIEKCARTDSYGCVNWQPSQLPEGESRESLNEKKRELLIIYSQEGQRGAQRRDINATSTPSVSDLQKEWPFLFMQKFLLQHFCTLTGIELESRLRESLAGKSKRVLQYFKSQLLKWKKDVKTVLYGLDQQMEDVDSGLAAILVMIAYFKDKEDALFLLADVNIPLYCTDAEAQISLPSIPRLIMLGKIPKWMLSIEGRVVLRMSDHSDFTSALAVLFGSFYVFNIEYPEEAATTLEFIQRFFVRINPEQSKCASKVQGPHV
uniref:Uncharacterized protein n=1 Tax=Paramormyrops kingsleyae TaxID=1676925 RepID=A0A3B3QPE7_9TELE